VRGVKGAGYARSDRVPGDVMTGVAIPILMGETVLGTLAIRYFHKAISEKTMVRDYLGPLRCAAEEIADACVRLGPTLAPGASVDAPASRASGPIKA
jgi:hypothetical protein